jgi:hypothetical protein
MHCYFYHALINVDTIIKQINVLCLCPVPHILSESSITVSQETGEEDKYEKRGTGTKPAVHKYTS